MQPAPRTETAPTARSPRAAGRALQSVVCTAMAASLGACGAPPEDEVVPVGEAPERWATGAELDDDLSGDLRPEALELIRARAEGEPENPIVFAWQPPATIRVWRRGLDGS